MLNTDKPIKKIVVLGGGTSGWLSAALLKKVIGGTIDVELVESESIGTVGVGEATIPPIRLVNQVLGINEAEFIRETKATIKLAIKFENWRVENESYYHTFGVPGRSMAFCHFHHFWKRAKTLGLDKSLWDYDLNYLCCKAGKFAQINAKDAVLDMPYAYHFDASLYAKFLRGFCEKMGVVRTEGKVDKVHQNAQTGNITGFRLDNGKEVSGDLFIDCSGFRGLLIQQTLNTGYEDWTHWLPCDRAVAIPSERHQNTAPYTRAIAHSAGWQWRIPLQHRNGNGLVYSSQYYSEQEAETLLLKNLDTKPLDEPNHIQFRTGRRRQQWHKNVVCVGLASGFLEPLESTSIHLIQSAITRLIQLFPHKGISRANIAEYNEQSRIEYEQIRDFIILHYHVNERDDSGFWRDLRQMEIPSSLQHKIDLFSQTGKLFREQNDLFLESSWLQVMLGQGIEPKDYHPLANNMDKKRLFAMLSQMEQLKQEPLSKLPTHDQFLANFMNTLN
jgi:tryptophan halogenase